jgi:chondroitin AC lyase
LKHSIFFFLLFFSGIYAASFAQQSSISILKQNLRNYYLSAKTDVSDLELIVNGLNRDTSASDQVTREIYERKNADHELVNKYIATVKSDGSWSDINYKDSDRSGWEPAKHAERILFLTKVYMNPGSPFYKNEILGKALHNAMDFWFKAKLICPNWWYNEIGVPKTLGPAFILLRDLLTPDELASAVQVMNHSHFRMTGQNKVWLAGNIFFKALLIDDETLARQARDTIVSEIKLTDEEGIQCDFSFHQHGPQPQFGNYGLAFITGMAFWGRIFDGTSLAFNEEQKGILRNLFNNGYNWISWKGYFDINSLGRQFFKDAQVTKALATGFAAADMIVTDPEHKQIYLDFLSRNFSASSEPHLTGDKHFWRSDMSVHRASSWYSSIRMSSERVKAAEALNNENLKGYYVGDGATFIMVDGNEYDNIFPVWSWRKLPGVTCYQSNEPLQVLTIEGYRNNSDFAGGLSNGLNGITAFHLVRDSLTAKKAWFFIDDVMVCLGADISSDKKEAVSTSLNQAFLRGDVYYFDGITRKLSPESQISSETVKWVFHNKIGYYPLQRSLFTISDKRQYGNWNDIAKIYPSNLQSDKIFSISSEHGISPQHQSYSYVILPGITLDEIKRYKPSFKVIENNSSAQIIISHDKNRGMFVVYNPLKINIEGIGEVGFEQAGLYMLEKESNFWKLTAADPTHKLHVLKISFNGKEYQLDLPQSCELGKSVSIKLD